MSVKTYNAECDYPITTPSGRVIEPPTGRCWRLSKNAFFERLADNRISFGVDGNSVPCIKRFLSELKFEGMAPQSIMFYKDVGHSQEGAKEVTALLESGAFDGPKPLRLLHRLLTLANTSNNDIILDFFSGSATTAHAVMQLNAEDGGNRRFICVQLPEVCDENSEAYKAGYPNICEIGKERIRRAGEKIKGFLEEAGYSYRKLQNNSIPFKYAIRREDDESCHPNIMDNPDIITGRNAGLYDTPPNMDKINSQMADDLDIGFKVFKLDTSNLVEWDSTPIPEHNLTLFYERLNSMTAGIKPDRTDMDVVCEIMLKMGVPLDTPLSSIQINNKTAYSVGESCLLLICLQDDISAEDIETMAAYAPANIICAESAFKDDSALSNAHYILRDKSIELKLI